MSEESDDDFYGRADAHIHLSNDQAKDIGRGKVSASMMYATARFNSWVCACSAKSEAEMAASRDENVQYFVEQFQAMLEENYNEYVENFDQYMSVKKNA